MFVPPDMANNTLVIHTFCSTIDDVACKANEMSLLFRDFNLSNLDWIPDETNSLMLQVDYESSRITDNCYLLLDCTRIKTFIMRRITSNNALHRQ